MSSLKHMAPAQHVPNDINTIIEISAESGPVKYEIDKETGLLMVDRFMPTAMHYPCNYGFVPNTLSLDGDPVDVLVLTPLPVQAGSLIRVRALGLLTMTDESGEDCKILALPIEKVCAQLANIKHLNDIGPIILDRITHFFEQYKALEPNKWVKVGGWQGVEAASRELEQSIHRYQVQAKVTAE